MQTFTSLAFIWNTDRVEIGYNAVFTSQMEWKFQCSIKWVQIKTYTLKINICPCSILLHFSLIAVSCVYNIFINVKNDITTWAQNAFCVLLYLTFNLPQSTRSKLFQENMEEYWTNSGYLNRFYCCFKS